MSRFQSDDGKVPDLAALWSSIETSGQSNLPHVLGHYSCVRIVTDADIETTFPLIALYVRDRQCADSIIKMVVDPKAWPSKRGWSMFAPRPEEKYDLPMSSTQLVEDAYATIEAFVYQTGLNNTTTKQMIAALQWKRDFLLCRPGYNDPSQIDGGFLDNNHSYATAATTILITLARNLKTLYLGTMHHCTTLVDLLLHANYGRLPAPSSGSTPQSIGPVLQNLETLQYISLSQFSDERCYDHLDFLAYLRCFHRLADLHTIVMDGVTQYQDVLLKHVQPRTGCFSVLRITHVDIQCSLLASMIRVPRALEEFVFVVGGLMTRDGASFSIHPGTLGKALCEHKTTLQILDLDFGGNWLDFETYGAHGGEGQSDDEEEESSEGEDDEWSRIDEADSTGSRSMSQLPNNSVDETSRRGIGSLQDFTALRHLKIGIEELLGVTSQGREAAECPFRLIDTLPSGLVSIGFYRYKRGQNAMIDQHVNDLIVERETRLPHLQEISGVEVTLEVQGRGSHYISDDDCWVRPHVDVNWCNA